VVTTFNAWKDPLEWLLLKPFDETDGAGALSMADVVLGDRRSSSEQIVQVQVYAVPVATSLVGDGEEPKTYADGPPAEWIPFSEPLIVRRLAGVTVPCTSR
jgi:hypothetical protein